MVDRMLQRKVINEVTRGLSLARVSLTPENQTKKVARDLHLIEIHR